jgi:glutathione synthase/RimK-type ligase-like ATP-grasp enzyme
VARVLVLRAGFAASNNLIRSLKAGDPSLFVVGCNDDRFALKQSPADRKYMVPVFSHADFGTALRRVIETETIDVVVPNTDADVAAVSELRDRLPCRTFLPRKSVIERCQDKYELARFLDGLGLPVPMTRAIRSLDEIDKIFGEFPDTSMLWCRIRKGTGSAGAIPVKSPEQVRAWISYWQVMRGVPSDSFTLSEYLPGRDLTVQCLLRHGDLLAAKMYERLSYHVSGGGPSGVSSTAALAKMLYEPPVLEIAIRAIRMLDAKASSVYFVDLKESATGEPCITEINAGRFANVPTIHDLIDADNMAVAYIRAALGETMATRGSVPDYEERYVLRALDSAPAVFDSHALAEGIHHWNKPNRQPSND